MHAISGREVSLEPGVAEERGAGCNGKAEVRATKLPLFGKRVMIPSAFNSLSALETVILLT